MSGYSGAIACILRGGTSTEAVGTGIVLDDHCVLTCAHVVNEALDGRDTFAGDAPKSAVIRVTVPHREGGKEAFQMGVIPELWWAPVEDPAYDVPEDIAVLALPEGARFPPNVATARLIDVDLRDEHDRRVWLTGFPAGGASDRIGGRINGINDRGRLQVDPELASRVVSGGFSGAGIWDEGYAGIVGMLIAKRGHGDATIAYGLPINVVAREVGLSLTPSDNATIRLRKLCDSLSPPRYYSYVDYIQLTLVISATGQELHSTSGAFNYLASHNSIIIGAQGSGKSSLSTQLHNYLQTDTTYGHVFPLFFDLERTRVSDIIQHLQTALSLVDDARTRTSPVKRLHLILDSLDKSVEHREVTQFMLSNTNAPHRLSITLLSQEVHAASAFAHTMQELRLQPLTNSQIKRIIIAGSCADITLGEFNTYEKSGLFDVLRTPFWATTFALCRKKPAVQRHAPNCVQLYDMIDALYDIDLSLATDDDSHAKKRTLFIEAALKQKTRHKGFLVNSLQAQNINARVFMYRGGDDHWFFHGIACDYLYFSGLAATSGRLALIWKAFQFRADKNLAFLAYSIPDRSVEPLLATLWPIVEWTIDKSGYLTGWRNPFLYLYIKLLVRHPTLQLASERSHTLVRKMIENFFAFSFELQHEITALCWSQDMRTANTHYIVGQLKTPEFLKYLIERNREALDGFSIFGFLNFCTPEVVDFLLEAIGRTASAEPGPSMTTHSMASASAVSVLVSFPGTIVIDSLRSLLEADKQTEVRSFLVELANLLANTKRDLSVMNEEDPSGDNVARERDVGRFDDDVFARVTESAAWLSLLFTCFVNVSNEVSRVAFTCLKNHTRSGVLREDIVEKMLNMCEDENYVIRSRAINAAYYSARQPEFVAQWRAVIINCLENDEEMLVRLSALDIARLIFRDLFCDWVAPILLPLSMCTKIEEHKFDQCQKLCREHIEMRGIDVSGQRADKTDELLMIAVNAPDDMMRSCGLEVLGEMDAELAMRVGEWLIMHTHVSAHEEHRNVFRVISNLNVSVREDVVIWGLLAENVLVRSAAINCVDERNFSEKIQAHLERVHSEMPAGWRHINGQIERIIETKGRERRF